MPTSSDNSNYMKRFPIKKWPEKQWRAELAKLDAELAAKHYAIDYSSTPAFENVAIYTPALSQGWINTVQRAASDPKKNPLPQLPDFQLTAEDLQFTNPTSRLCFYPWVLYSAGQAINTKTKHANKAWSNNWLTAKPRDSRVVVIGDSGGFQIQEQSMAFAGDPTVVRILRWLEAVADQSMVMDFPTGKIALGNLIPHTQRLLREGVPISDIVNRTGIDSGFITCLIQTIRNNRTYVRERVEGSTRLLNVLQGRNEQESREWFDRVKVFPFDGWAFAGKHHSELAMTLRRLISMRDAGLLRRCKWIHFLGVSTFKVATVLSYLQRSIRRHTDASDLQITFDSKSPIDSIINGYRPLVGYDFDPTKWNFRVHPLKVSAMQNDDRFLIKLGEEWQRAGEHRFVPRTALSYRLRLNQLVKRIAKTGKIQPDGVQQALMIHHNTQVYFEGFRRAYSYLGEQDFGRRPSSIQFMEQYIDAVFRSETPMSFIDDAEFDLNRLAME